MSTGLTENERQIYARLTMHETLLEIIMAKTLAQDTLENESAFIEATLSRMRSHFLPHDADDRYTEDALGVLQDASVLGERFFDKVIHHSASLRE